MTAQEKQNLLAGFATNALSRQDTQWLFAEARRDPKLFAEMTELAQVRAAFALPGRRAVVRSAVEHELAKRRTRTSRFSFLWAWAPWLVVSASSFIRSVTPSPGWSVAAAAGTAALVIFAALLFYPRQLRPEPLKVTLASDVAATHRTMSMPPPVRDLDKDALVSLPEHHSTDVRFGFDRPGNIPVYRIGDQMRIGVSVPRGSQIVILDVHSAQEAYVLYPQTATLTGVVNNILTAPADGNFLVAGPPGERRIRVIILPGSIDLNHLSTATVKRQAAVWDFAYSVAGIN